jgi:sarcosine oxidase
VDPASAKASTCLYTTTPDHHFIVDRSGPVTVLAGFSGHGFKFTPAIGELAAGLVSGAARAPAEFAFGRRAATPPATALAPAIRQIRQGS